MAITINVQGTNSGGNNQPQQQQINTSNQNYQRPDFNQYAPSSMPASHAMPTSDQMVSDIRAEISRRGVVLVPGTQNFSTMINTLQQNQRSNIMGTIEGQYNARMYNIDSRRDALMYDINSKLESARQFELSKTNDPITIKNINDRYDRLARREEKAVMRYFQGEFDSEESRRSSEVAEAENRLAEAMQRLTEELSQGNKDSYINNLRDRYKAAVWTRDNAATEEEVRAASREAEKIQERMQRAMGGGVSPSMMRLLGASGTSVSLIANAAFQSAQISDKMQWGLGLEQASAILNGNAFQAIRQRNAYESQQASTWWGAGGAAAGALAGAAIGSAVPVIGTVVGGIIGGLIGGVGGHAGAYYLGGNRERLREDYRVQAADLWRSEEQRMVQFNDLAMLTRGRNNSVEFTRNWYINQSQDQLMKGLLGVGSRDGRAHFGNEAEPIVDAWQAFNSNDYKLDLYDLGYTAPEFAKQASRRILQRGFVSRDSMNNALYADALERVFSMNSGTLGQLSAYDRFGRNNANQDFANLAVTLDALGTIGMRQGAWARSDEFAGYMTQLQQGQRSTFLTVDNARAARQIATGQQIFGTRFGAEALQGIQQVNNTIQNPKGGFAQTLLYDVIQELFPYTRGRIDLIEQAQYDPEKQNEIQQAYQRRIQSIYGGVDTTAGYLAAQEIWGIQNPNVMMPIVRQLGKKNGGLEARGLKTADQDELVKPISEGGYTPEVSKQLNIAADNQMSNLLNRADDLVSISRDLLKVLRDDINGTLDEAMKKLGQ